MIIFKIIGLSIIGLIATVIVIYVISYIQMNGWLKAFENRMNKQSKLIKDEQEKK